MPYVSNAQRRKFHAMLARGEISEEVVKEYDRQSKGMVLPECVGEKKGGRKRRIKGKKGKELEKMYSRVSRWGL